MATITAPEDAQVIEVNGQAIDPSEHYARDAKDTDHIILTSKNVLQSNERRELKKRQVELLEDLGNNNMLCRYKPSNLEPLRRLDFIKQVDVYRNLYKIPAVLQGLIDETKRTESSENPERDIDVWLHQDVKDLDSLVAHISQVAQIDKTQMEITPECIRLPLNLSELEAIAADDRVRILEEVVTPVLMDDEAKRLVSAPVRIQDLEYRGEGQTIAVVDSGFDLGSLQDCHPAFSTGQIQKLIPLGRAKESNLSEAQKVDDPKGHGTHVCGTIVGKEIKTCKGMVGGVAQDAKVILTSLEKSDGQLTRVSDMWTLYQLPYDTHEARVHSNSWGDGLLPGRLQAPYTTAGAKIIDDFVRSNADALICFSAGNNNLETLGKEPAGTPKPAIGSQASAKNCLTVGASGSSRITGAPPPWQEPAELDPDQIHPKSSRGPTVEKRIKPDVVAPGYNIFSAHSRHPKSKGNTAAAARSDSYPDVLWKVRSGTSHATPMVSGCAAILRQILQGQGLEKPPAALIKALIINGADTLPGVDIEAQGFGRVNLQSSVDMLQSPPVKADSISSSDNALSAAGGALIGLPLKQGEKLDFVIHPGDDVPPADEAELKITMVYNDIGGAAIQNNLNLAVIESASGIVKHGGISEDKMDVQNNVEQVVWCPMPKGEIVVRVMAQKIFDGGDQDFVVVWRTGSPLNRRR